MTDLENKTITPRTYAEDEISLYDLYGILAKHSKLILFVLISVIICGTIYVFLAPKIYQTTVRLRAPLPSDVYLTNITIPLYPNQNDKSGSSTQIRNDMAVTSPSPTEVFADFLRALGSNGQWQLFLHARGKLSAQDILHLPPGNPVSVESKSDHAIIKYTSTSSESVTKILHRYFVFTQSTVVNKLRQQLKVYLSHERETLNNEIQIAKEYRTRRANERAEKLARMVELAKKLHVLQSLRVQFNEAEESSTSEKEIHLALLNHIKILHTGFRAYQLDGNTVAPVQPLKPRKKLILVLSAVLGLFLGIFAAFIAEFFTKLREQGKNNG